MIGNVGQELIDNLYLLLHMYYILSIVLSTLCSVLHLMLKRVQQDSFYCYHSLGDEETEALGGSSLQG